MGFLETLIDGYLAYTDELPAPKCWQCGAKERELQQEFDGDFICHSCSDEHAQAIYNESKGMRV